MTSRLWCIGELENKLYGYADDSTLVAVLSSICEGAQLQNLWIVMLTGWCDLWGMKLNESKLKSMIVSRSFTIHLQSISLTLNGTLLKVSDDPVIMGVTFDAKMAFDKHLQSVSRATARLICTSQQLRASTPVYSTIFRVIACTLTVLPETQ